jgi:hypothetical protein
MAKKRQDSESAGAQRQSRKEYLRSKREAKQKRQVYLVVAGVGGLLLLILIFALVNEYVLAPNRAVATINGEEISLREWENRVRYERAQRIIVLENQFAAFNGDVGLIQQFAGQQINELYAPEELGQIVIDTLVNEAVIRQAAQVRGIGVTEEEVDDFIGEAFNYFGGDSPTPLPTPTQTVMPTPSLTPIPTAVITEELPTNTPFPSPTVGPTTTPLPTATAVSQEAFEQEANDLFAQFQEMGVDEATYRSVVRAQIYLNKFSDALAEETDLPDEEEMVSFYLLSFNDEGEANAALDGIEAEGFLTVWNTIRSTPPDPEVATITNASEILWRRQEDLANFGTEVQTAVFELPLNTSSDILVAADATTDTATYYLVQVSGREVRPLSQNALDTEKRENLTSFLDSQIAGGLEITEFWRSRVPTQPVLDPKFLVPPTPDPAQQATTPGAIAP